MPEELILGLHCHQPVGNFPFVFRQAFEKAYRPILETLEKWPRVRVSLHYSGPLLEWLEAEEKPFLVRLRKLVERAQVELWGSGFYEPVLPTIPRADRLDQLRAMSDRLEELFGKRPRGLWLTERVWEPALASDLVDAGIEYIAVDDHHFRLAGLDPATLSGYFLTEDDGRPLGVFPILKELRYRIPFEEPERVLEFLHERAARGASGTACFYDDGEKLGVWPKTFESVWGKRWLERLFALLSDEKNGVRTILPGEVKDRDRPRGRVYLPTASYPEMMEWAFPAETGARFEDLLERVEHTEEDRWREARPFLAGGFFRNFLVKFPEINFLQKRVNRASRVLREKLKGKPREDALRELFRAECNCAYWHGVFGGAYLPHLRRALWEHLLKAESAAAPATLAVEESDLEVDGVPDVRIDHPAFSAHLKPGAGGALLALDLRKPAYPLLDVIARRREAYHSKMVPAALAPPGTEPGGIHGRVKVLPEGVEVVSDWHRRASLVDHLYTERPDARGLANARFRDAGDFAIEPFTKKIDREKDGVTVRLAREGSLFLGESRRPLSISRTIRFPAAATALEVRWEIENLSREPIEAWLATDWNLAFVPTEGLTHIFHESKGRETVFPDPKDPKPWEGPLPPQLPFFLDATPASRCGFRDRSLAREVRLSLDPEGAFLVAYPVTTVSQSEKGVDLVHQGTCLAILRRLSLPPSGKTTFGATLSILSL
ncbi:DUF1926 domain-containing protein [bacterium]|nr:DUF1926 domain-containing protein [bacterium]